MVDFILDIYRYFRSHRMVCWLSMTALFLLFGLMAMQVQLVEDINSLMPSSRNEDGTTKLAFANLKIKDKTFLLFERCDGEPSEALADICDEFVDSLGCDTTLVEDIFFQVPEDVLLDAAYYLSDHLPAYIDTAVYRQLDSMLTPAAMAKQMKKNRSDMESPLGEQLSELIERDPMGLRNMLKEQLMGESRTHTDQKKTSYLLLNGHIFVRDTTVCVAFLTPRFSATNTGEGTALFEKLDSQIARFAALHPEVRISYHGTPAHGYDNARQIKHDLVLTIGISLALVLLVVYAFFRRKRSNEDRKSLPTLLLLVLPVAFGALVGLSAMWLIRGQFSLLALGIGAVVLGVSFSYVLHILIHHRFVGSPELVLMDETKPVFLGCLTTIGSFCGLLFVKTDLLRDFGLFAIFAILGTCFFTLVYLPQMLSVSSKGDGCWVFGDGCWMKEKDSRLRRRANNILLALTMTLTVVCVCLCFIGGGARFDSDMHNLGYVSPRVSHSEQLLRAKTYTGDKQRYFASSGKTLEEALSNFALLDHKLDSLKGLGLVKDYQKTNNILVPLMVQQERIDAWKAYWTAERLHRLHTLIATTAPAAGLNADAFQPFFDMMGTDFQPERLYEADIIPNGFLSTLTENSLDGQYLCFTSVRCANDTVRTIDSDYQRICDAVSAEPNLLVLDTYYYTQDTLRQMHSDFDMLQWLSMLFVLLVLLLSFRFNVRHTLLAFMPILLSWFVVLGAMYAFDVRFNLVSIVVSTFIFGIGVDYSIFVMAGLTSDGNQKLLESHKAAVLLSALILVISVSSMLFATHPAIHSVGFTTLVGLVAAFVLSYIAQPAIFRIIYNKNKK